MKKILLSTVACVTMAAQAQNVTVVKQMENDDFGIIPAAYTSQGKTLFYLGYCEKDYGSDELKIMDSSFGDVKTIKFPSKTFESYTISYDAKFELKKNYVDSHFDNLPDYDCTEEALETDAEIRSFWNNYYGTDVHIENWAADTMIVVRYKNEYSDGVSADGHYYLRSNPKRYGYYYVRWNKVYTGEHEANGVKEFEGASTYTLFMGTSYFNVVNSDDEYYDMPVSQTLFNDDNSFEYLRPEYEMGLDYAYFENWSGKYLEKYRPVTKAFSIVQDNGTVLATIHATVGQSIRDVTVVKSYDDVYFLVEEDEYTIVYKWGQDGSGISRVKEISTMRAYPNPLHRSEMVTVDVPENMLEGSLIVTNSAGMTLQTVKLNGQRQAAVSTARMSSGVYNVTLVSGGKRLQTSKIIVK